MQPTANRVRHAAVRFLSTALFTLGPVFVATPARAVCTPPAGANEIVVENCLAGNPQSEWAITGSGDAAIQGFATDISYDQGATAEFKIKTTATAYHIDIYRLGWYGGDGARRVATIPNSATIKSNQVPCLGDETAINTTHIVDCGNWTVSASWPIPANATSGVYIARLVREDDAVPHGASHIVFIVRDDDGGSDLLFQTPDTTWQAYNRYGGFSLYFPSARAYKVSYNRPFTTADHNAESWLFGPDYPMLRWIERNGFDVSYFTGVDSDRLGGELLEHKIFISEGHDEYWSAGQRENVEEARDNGVNLAFFSGNDVFWKIRWENNFTGVTSGVQTFGTTPYRTLTCYKETAANIKLDPGVDGDGNPLWTGTWRDTRFGPHDGGRPENSLTGTLFMVNRDGTTSIEVPAEDGKLRFWRNTTVALQAPGTFALLPFGVLGYEWNEDVDNGLRPAGQIRLSTTVRSNMPYLSDVVGNIYRPSTATHHLTMHRRGNALVFSAGSVQWSWGLDETHNSGVSLPAQIPAQDIRMQQATLNLFADMGAQAGSIQPGLAAASASTDTTPPTSTITSPANGAALPSGKQITISGTAADSPGGVVGGVEVSTDGGVTWHPAKGRTSWTYKWTPVATEIETPKSVTILSRATDDSLRTEITPASVNVTIEDPATVTCPCTIWSPTESVGPQSDDAAAINVGVKFRSDSDGYITAIRFYKHLGNTGTHTAFLWTAPATGTGTLLGSATFTGESGQGWQEVPLTPPVQITAGATYIAAYHTTSGFYAVSRSYFDVVGVDNPPLHALAEGVQGPNGVFAYGIPGQYPAGTFGYSNYWVDVVFNTTANDSAPPTVIATTPLAGATGVIIDDDITATFSEAMDAASIDATTFELRDDITSALVPASVSFVAGTRTAVLAPTTILGFSTRYRATVRGNGTGVRDLAGNRMVSDFSWTFTTAADSGCPCSLFASQTPALINEDSTPVNLGLRFQASVNGFVKGVRFYKPSQNNGTSTGFLYTGNGVLLASAPFQPAPGVAGWQTATFSAPVAINADTTYVAAYHTDGGFFPVTRPFFGSTITSGPLRALQNTATAPNGSYRYGTFAFPSDNPGDGPNYWADVVFDTTTADHTGPTIVARTPGSGASIVPVDVNVTATFSEPVDASLITSANFTLRDPASNAVTANLSYDPATNTATLDPAAPLSHSTTYTATVRGTGVGIRDIAGNPLVADEVWSFTTMAPAPSFTAGADVTVAEDSSAYSSAWATGITSGPVVFNVSSNNTGLFSSAPAVSPTGTLTFTPAANAFGTATITVFATNTEGTPSPSATFTITITGINDAPTYTAGAAVVEVAEDAGGYNATWATNVTAGPGESSQNVTFVINSNDEPSLFTVQPAFSASGVLTFTPAPDAFGTASINLHVQDDGGVANGGVDRTANFALSIRITSANDAPRFTSGGSVTVLEDSAAYNAPWATAITPGPPNETGSVTFSVSNNNNSLFATQPAISPAGVLTFTPATNAFGTTTATVTASDDESASAVATFTITLTGVNDAPSFTAGANVSVAEDSVPYTAAWASVMSAGPNEETQTFSFLVTNNNDDLFMAQPSVSATGQLSFTPSPDASGLATVTVRLQDDGGTANSGVDTSASQTFTIEITPVNDPATFTPGGDVTVDEDFGTFSELWAQSVRGGPEGESQTVSFVVTTSNDELFAELPTLTSGGVLSFVAAPNANGSALVTVVAVDSDDASSQPDTFTISVVPVNDAPLAAADTFTMNEGGTLTVLAPGVLGNDTDIDSTTLTATALTSPAHGTFVLSADGSLTYVHDGTETTSASFTYKVNDGLADSNIATVTINITPADDPGVAVDDGPYSVIQGQTLSVGAPGLLANDTDIDSTTFTAIGVTSGAHGLVTVNGDGSFTYVHDNSESLTDSFTYKVNGGTADSNVATVTINITPSNQPPTAVNDSYSVNEGATLTVSAPGVIGNDTDPNSADTLTAALVSTPLRGTLSLNADGSFTYAHDGSETTSDSFTYRVSDGRLDSDVATVTLTIAPVNDAPVAANDSYTVAEGATLNVAAPGVLNNDTDVDGSSRTAILVSGPANGTLTLNANGSFTYAHNGGETASDSFTYRASDGSGQSEPATVSITITPVNDAPVANNDAFTTPEDTVLIGNVLTNDVDPDSATPTASVITAPTRGALALNANGSFTYTPAANLNGPDSFTYRLSDGAATSNTATVSINVTAVNDTPDAVNDAATTYEDLGLRIVVLANDSDVDGNALTVSSVTQGANGATAINADGSVQYTPTATFNGTDSFNYTASDGQGGTDTATVTVTVRSVNSAPLGSPDTYTTNEDVTLSVPAPGVLGNDTDPEGDAFTAILSTPAAHGTVTLNSNGSFTFVPEANFSGTDSFKYTPKDSGLIVSTDDIAADFLAGTPGGCTATTLTNGEVMLSPATGGFIEPFTATALPAGWSSNGTVTFPGGAIVLNGGTIRSPNNLTAPRVLEFVATFAAAANQFAGFGEGNNAQVFRTMPFAAFTTGAGTQVIARSFVGGTASNITLPAGLAGSPHRYRIEWTTTAVTYFVDGVSVGGHTITLNNPRAAAHETTSGGAALSVDWMRLGPYATPCTFTSRVHFGDGGTWSQLSATTNTHASSTVSFETRSGGTEVPDGSWSAWTAVSGNVITSPAAPYLQYRVQLATTNAQLTPTIEQVVVSSVLPLNETTVTLNVTPVNDGPSAANDTYAATEDTLLQIPAPGVLSNDTDIDSASLTAVLVSTTSHGLLTLNADGSFDYTPELNYSGPDSFSYRASDGSLQSNIATVTINIAAADDGPVANADSFTANEDETLVIAAPGVLANDTDADGDALSAVVVTGPSHGSLTLNADGSFTYVPSSNYNGPDSFTYKATAGSVESAPSTVTLTINPVNDAPVAIADSASTDEDTAVSGNVLTNDTDEDTTTPALTAILVSDVTHGTLTLGTLGNFTYTPAADYHGSDTFTYKANDGTADSNTVTVTITVDPVNDAPAASADAYTNDEDTALTIAAPGVLDNDSDIDGDGITAALVTGPSHGTVTLNADGSFLYTPAADFNGADSFTYRTTDGTLFSAAAAVSITVNPVNDAPHADDDAYGATEDIALVITAPGVLGNDDDADGDTLTATVASGPSRGSLTLNGDGSFTYTPNPGLSGADTFTYRVNDGSTDSNTAAVTINVAAVNDAPDAAADAYSTNEDTPLSVGTPGVLLNDSDGDSASITALLVDDVDHGALVLNTDGSFTYTPALNFNGTDTFEYRANDGALNSTTVTVTITVNPVNDAPVATNDTYQATEDTPLTVAVSGVLANDNDVDGDDLTATLASGASHGTATLNADGSFTYVPAAGYFGPDAFTYTTTDGNAVSNTATVSITVNAVNDPPVAAADSYSTDEDTALTVGSPGVLSNDADPESSALQAVLVDSPLHGVLTLNANGSFSYMPQANYAGADSFTYMASDTLAQSSTVTVTITINPVNDAPSAAADSYSVDEDATLEVSAPGVLANDTDLDSTTLTAVLVSGTANGALTLNAGGSFTYVPNADYSGSDTFTYKANDGALDSNTVTVTITVNGVNDAPTAADDSYVTDEDTPLTVGTPGVLGNDSDIDSATLQAVLVAGPSHGTLALNANGSFTYTPALNYNGGDNFTYRARDGSLNSDQVTVTITVNAVNDAPLAANDSYNATEDTPLSVPGRGVLGNDSDVEDSALTASVGAAPLHGTLSLAADGSFTYTPSANFNGVDSFTYRASDGAATSAFATVTLNVAPVNDPPSATNDSYITTEDVPLSVPAPGVLGNDADIDGDGLSAVLVSGPAHGTLTLSSNGSFTYAPEADYNGPDAFSYSSRDGSLNSPAATVSLTVSATNDAPSAENDSYSTDEDTPLVIAAPGVLSNDSDRDGGAITAVVVSQPSHGTLSLNANGGFTYTPAADYNGSDSFTYKASDGDTLSNIATVAITISPVADAPLAQNDSYTTAEDATLTISAPGVLTNDADADGSPMTAVLVDGPAHGTLSLNATGAFVYTPGSNYNGADAFTYKASDGALQSNTATVAITITAVNDPPVAQDDNATTSEDVAVDISVLTNDSDTDLDTLQVSAVSTSAHGAVVVNAGGTTVRYTPAGNYNGPDSFTYTASDGRGGLSTATVSVTVNAVNDAPDAVADSATTNEETAKPIDVLANDTDIDGNMLSITGVTQPLHGSVAIASDNRSVTYTPASNYAGGDSFTYSISDGNGGTDSATVSVSVIGVNDAPVAADNNYTTAEDVPLVTAAPGVLGNDTDADGAPLTAILVVGPVQGSLSLNSNGSFQYTPAPNYNGPDSFTYKANDGTADSNVATVSIMVTAVNDSPTANPDIAATTEDTAIDVLVLANDTDADLNTLTITIAGGASHGTVSINPGAQSVRYVPAANYNGPDSFTYTVSDGSGGTAFATVSMTITPVDDAPIANTDSFTTTEDTILNVAAPGVLGNDNDADASALAAILVASPARGSLTLNANGSFAYTPESNYNGSDSFTYKVSDGVLESNIVTVSITITPVNDLPAAVNDSYSTSEDAALTISAPGVLANDTDVETTSLTAVVVSGPLHGTLTLNANGGFTYTPAANYNGSDGFTYRASDGTGQSSPASVSITITPVADTPAPANDSFSTFEDTPLTGNVLSNDSDADGNALTASVVTGPTKGSLTLGANGAFTYTPNAHVFGPDTFTYRASDGSLSATATVSITITSVNDPPAAANDSYNATQDTALSVAAPGVLGNDTDIDSGALTAIQITPPSNGVLALSSNGGFTYTPAAGYSGTDSFTYQARDGAAYSNTATVTITVASAGIGDTTAAQFSAGTPGTCSVVTSTGDGEVTLTGVLDESFTGSILPAGWSGSGSVSGGVLIVNGSSVFTASSYTPGRPLEFIATFGAEANQAAGFGVNLGAGESWATFGTAASTSTLYARISNMGTVTETAIPGSWLGAPHRYRIDWNASQVVFRIDGNVVHTQDVAIAGTMRPIISDGTPGGPALAVQSLRLGPFATPCTFISRVLDGGTLTNWTNLQAVMALPDGATFSFDTRSGNAAAPDATWSVWAPVSGSTIASPDGRYIQYRVTLSTFDGGATPELQQVIINPTKAPLVGISDATITETNLGQNMTFNVSLSTPTSQPVVVSYKTATGSAVSPADYSAVTSTVTIPAGGTSASLIIPIAGDTLHEDSEKFFVNLTGATNGFVADPQGAGTINNDDVQSARISIGDVAMAEGNAGTTMMRFPVTLSVASGKTITVNYTLMQINAIAGEDYVASPGTLTIPAGATLQYLSIPIKGDTKYEGTEQFMVQLSVPVNATILDSVAVGTITNDDTL